jgi:uncharacterized alpha-E superfamily protein
MSHAAENSDMAQRRTAEDIQQVVNQYRASGLTQAEYCRQNGMVLSTLGRYLRRGAGGSRTLVRVKVAAAEPQGGFVLMLSNGRRIAADWAFSDAELARLIRVAETA